MHSAPSVTYTVGRSLLVALLLSSLRRMGALLGGWWWLGVAAPGWRQWLAVLMLPLAGIAAWRSLQGLGVGDLRWDGQLWLWQGGAAFAAEPVRLAVHLDLQRHLLLKLRPERGPALWCWARRQSQPERWGDLRRAVYSPARSEAVSDDAAVPTVKPAAAPASPKT